MTWIRRDATGEYVARLWEAFGIPPEQRILAIEPTIRAIRSRLDPFAELAGQTIVLAGYPEAGKTSTAFTLALDWLETARATNAAAEPAAPAVQVVRGDQDLPERDAASPVSHLLIVEKAELLLSSSASFERFKTLITPYDGFHKLITLSLGVYGPSFEKTRLVEEVKQANPDRFTYLVLQGLDQAAYLGLLNHAGEDGKTPSAEASAYALEQTRFFFPGRKSAFAFRHLPVTGEITLQELPQILSDSTDRSLNPDSDVRLIHLLNVLKALDELGLGNPNDLFDRDIVAVFFRLCYDGDLDDLHTIYPDVLLVEDQHLSTWHRACWSERDAADVIKRIKTALHADPVVLRALWSTQGILLTHLMIRQEISTDRWITLVDGVQPGDREATVKTWARTLIDQSSDIETLLASVDRLSSLPVAPNWLQMHLGMEVFSQLTGQAPDDAASFDAARVEAERAARYLSPPWYSLAEAALRLGVTFEELPHVAAEHGLTQHEAEKNGGTLPVYAASEVDRRAGEEGLSLWGCYLWARIAENASVDSTDKPLAALDTAHRLLGLPALYLLFSEAYVLAYHATPGMFDKRACLRGCIRLAYRFASPSQASVHDEAARFMLRVIQTLQGEDLQDFMHQFEQLVQGREIRLETLALIVDRAQTDPLPAIAYDGLVQGLSQALPPEEFLALTAPFLCEAGTRDVAQRAIQQRLYRAAEAASLVELGGMIWGLRRLEKVIDEPLLTDDEVKALVSHQQTHAAEHWYLSTCMGISDIAFSTPREEAMPVPQDEPESPEAVAESDKHLIPWMLSAYEKFYDQVGFYQESEEAAERAVSIRDTLGVPAESVGLVNEETTDEPALPGAQAQMPGEIREIVSSLFRPERPSRSIKKRDSQSPTRRANHLIRQNNLVEAMLLLEDHLEQTPDPTDTHLLLASIYNRLKKDKREETHLKEILARDPARADVLGKLAQLMVKSERWEEAEETLRRAIDHVEAPSPMHQGLLKGLVCLYEKMQPSNPFLDEGWEYVRSYDFNVEVIHNILSMLHTSPPLVEGRQLDSEKLACLFIDTYVTHLSAFDRLYLLYTAGFEQAGYQRLFTLVRADGDRKETLRNLYRLAAAVGNERDSAFLMGKYALATGDLYNAEVALNKMEDVEETWPGRHLLRCKLLYNEAKHYEKVGVKEQAEVRLLQALKHAELALWQGADQAITYLSLADVVTAIASHQKVEADNSLKRAMRYYHSAVVQGASQPVVKERLFTLEWKRFLRNAESDLRARNIDAFTHSMAHLMKQYNTFGKPKKPFASIGLLFSEITSLLGRICLELLEESESDAVENSFYPLYLEYWERAYDDLLDSNPPGAHSVIGDLLWERHGIEEQISDQETPDLLKRAITHWEQAQEHTGYNEEQQAGLAHQLEIKLGQAYREYKALKTVNQLNQLP